LKHDEIPLAHDGPERGRELSEGFLEKKLRLLDAETRKLFLG
jgi:hypothetical protein